VSETPDSERRIAKRIILTEPVRYQLKDPRHFGGGLSCDISEGGVRITLSEFVPLGSEFSLQINLANGRMIEGLARVVWIQKSSIMDRYEAGLEFLDPSESNSEISRYIESYHSN